MAKNLLKILVMFTLVFVIVVIAQPCRFSVGRSITINAPASVIFALVDDQQQWERWSPWAKLDPTAKFTYGESHAGLGSHAYWDGDAQIGKGSSTITESIPDQRIVFTLDIEKPMKTVDTLEFTFAPAGKATEVTWTMEGNNDFMGKAAGLVMNCKKMIGDQFERGLNNLKSLAERTAQP